MNIDNNKGFTLVELIATIVVLSLVMSIATYSVVTIINKSNEKDYQLFIKNIHDGAESYYNECKYMNKDMDICNSDYTVSLGDLVNYGFIKGNSKDSNGYDTLVNPKDKELVTNCKIRVSYNKEIKIRDITGSGSCPTTY